MCSLGEMNGRRVSTDAARQTLCPPPLMVYVLPWLSQNSLCGPGWNQTHRDLPVSASQGVLGLEVCDPRPS